MTPVEPGADGQHSVDGRDGKLCAPVRDERAATTGSRAQFVDCRRELLGPRPAAVGHDHVATVARHEVAQHLDQRRQPGSFAVGRRFRQRHDPGRSQVCVLAAPFHNHHGVDAADRQGPRMRRGEPVGGRRMVVMLFDEHDGLAHGSPPCRSLLHF